MKSITGIEYNNPKVCIKYAGSTFACVCLKCMEEGRKRMDEFFKEIDAKIDKELEGKKI